MSNSLVKTDSHVLWPHKEGFNEGLILRNQTFLGMSRMQLFEVQENTFPSCILEQKQFGLMVPKIAEEKLPSKPGKRTQKRHSRCS